MMAMIGGSAIDYTQRPYYKFHNFQTSVRVLSDVYRVFPEHPEHSHQLVEWRRMLTSLISGLAGLGPRLPDLETFFGCGLPRLQLCSCPSLSIRRTIRVLHPGCVLCVKNEMPLHGMFIGFHSEYYGFCMIRRRRKKQQ